MGFLRRRKIKLILFVLANGNYWSDAPKMICMWLLCVRGTEDGLREGSFLSISIRCVGCVRSGSMLDVRWGTGGVVLPMLDTLKASSDRSRRNRLVKLEREWPFLALPVIGPIRSVRTDTKRWWSSDDGAHVVVTVGGWLCGVVWWIGCQMAGSLGGVGGGGEA